MSYWRERKLWKIEQDWITLNTNQNQFQVDSKKQDNTQDIIDQNHLELENSNQSDSEHEHCDQNKINVEVELKNFESNMQHPKIISNQKCADKVTST